MTSSRTHRYVDEGDSLLAPGLALAWPPLKALALSMSVLILAEDSHPGGGTRQTVSFGSGVNFVRLKYPMDEAHNLSKYIRMLLTQYIHMWIWCLLE